MLKKSLLSSGGIFVMLVLALASLGVAYGLWSETLEVRGTVETGNVDIGFSGPKVGYGVLITNADHPSPGKLHVWEYNKGGDPTFKSDPDDLILALDGGTDPLHRAPDVKDVATCDANVDATPDTIIGALAAPSGAETGTNLITITVTGAYPSFHCVVAFDVTNHGSVPVLVHRPQISSGADAYVTTNFANCYAEEEQLEMGDNTSDCLIVIHFDNNSSIDENDDTTLSFNVTVFAHQWNEEG